MKTNFVAEEIRLDVTDLTGEDGSVAPALIITITARSLGPTGPLLQMRPVCVRPQHAIDLLAGLQKAVAVLRASQETPAPGDPH